MFGYKIRKEKLSAKKTFNGSGTFFVDTDNTLEKSISLQINRCPSLAIFFLNSLFLTANNNLSAKSPTSRCLATKAVFPSRNLHHILKSTYQI